MDCRFENIKFFVQLVFNFGYTYTFYFKDVRDRSAIMVCEVKFGAKILPAYSALDIKVE